MYGRMYHQPLIRKEKIVGFCALLIGAFVVAKLLGLLAPELFVPNESLGIIAGIVLVLFGLVLTFNNEHHY